jgi:hypothetical protein
MSHMPTMAGMFKKNYCQGDATECARHMIFKKLGREAVPADLFPNNHARAKEILGQ